MRWTCTGPARINRSVINVPAIRGMEEIWQPVGLPMLYTRDGNPRRDGLYDFLLFVRGWNCYPSVNDAVFFLCSPPFSPLSLEKLCRDEQSFSWFLFSPFFFLFFFVGVLILAKCEIFPETRIEDSSRLEGLIPGVN